MVHVFGAIGEMRRRYAHINIYMTVLINPFGGIGEAAAGLLGGRADRRACRVWQAQHGTHSGPSRAPGALHTEIRLFFDE